MIKKLKDFYKENGFVKVNSFITNSEATNLLNQLKLSIKECADSLNITEELYLQVIDSWGSSSHVTKIMNQELLDNKKKLLQNLFQKDFTCVKLNIRGKSTYFPHQTESHQDLPYAIKEPFEITAWLSLNKATEESGALLFQPGSQKIMNIPLDYWHPDFVDRYLTEPKVRQLLNPVSANPGDLIIFH